MLSKEWGKVKLVDKFSIDSLFQVHGEGIDVIRRFEALRR